MQKYETVKTFSQKEPCLLAMHFMFIQDYRIWLNLTTNTNIVQPFITRASAFPFETERGCECLIEYVCVYVFVCVFVVCEYVCVCMFLSVCLRTCMCVYLGV